MDVSNRGNSGDPAGPTFGGGGGGAGEAARVRRRLERIDALDRERAPVGRVLGELRELVHEAEAWVRIEAADRSREALSKLREEAEGMR
jgi:hypothetical protein